MNTPASPARSGCDAICPTALSTRTDQMQSGKTSQVEEVVVPVFGALFGLRNSKAGCRTTGWLAHSARCQSRGVRLEKIMKKLATASVCILASCTGCRHDALAPTKAAKVDVPESFEQAWVMSAGWQGEMGVAIALSRDRYYYWFYSDVRYVEEPAWPIVGFCTLSGGRLALSTNQFLYASTWLVETNGNRECLWAERDVGDYPRLLIPDPHFDPRNPFKNQGLLKAEPPAGGDGKPTPQP